MIAASTTTIEQMKTDLEQRSQEDQKKRAHGRIALIVGPDIPGDVLDLFTEWLYCKGVRVERILWSEPRTAAIDNGRHETIPVGALEQGYKPQRVYVLHPDHAKGFIETCSIQLFANKWVTYLRCSIDELGFALSGAWH